MNKSFLHRGLALSAPLLLWPSLAGAANIDGAVLSAWWGLPFAGILLSIALCPLLTPIPVFPFPPLLSPLLPYI